VQSALHVADSPLAPAWPSPLRSHVSLALAFTIPHLAQVQFALQAGVSPPVSHCSPFSTEPLWRPDRAAGHSPL
jgi:hypothetical protein